MAGRLAKWQGDNVIKPVFTADTGGFSNKQEGYTAFLYIFIQNIPELTKYPVIIFNFLPFELEGCFIMASRDIASALTRLWMVFSVVLKAKCVRAGMAFKQKLS